MLITTSRQARHGTARHGPAGEPEEVRPTVPTAVLCETEGSVVLGTAGLPFSVFVCSVQMFQRGKHLSFPSTHSFYNHRKKQKNAVCLFLTTPSVFLSPWQRSSFLIMRKLNLLVPKQQENKSHAHLGPWVLVTRPASRGCQEQTRGGQARPQDHRAGQAIPLSHSVGSLWVSCAW